MSGSTSSRLSTGTSSSHAAASSGVSFPGCDTPEHLADAMKVQGPNRSGSVVPPSYDSLGGLGTSVRARQKFTHLRLILTDIPDAVVGFSGGVDSSFLAVVARDAIGDALTAVIADSPSIPRRELTEAIEFAGRHDIRLEVVRTNEMEDPDTGATVRTGAPSARRRSPTPC